MSGLQMLLLVAADWIQEHWHSQDRHAAPAAHCSAGSLVCGSCSPQKAFGGHPAAARTPKTAGKSDNPLAAALGQCKGQSLPLPINGIASSKLTTILESPIEMWGEDY